jgi:GlpG protein
MRQIGSLADAERSQLFADYLQTQGISAHAEPDDAEWVIWVRDENDVERARDELGTFLRDPSASRYREVARQARRLRDEQQRQQQAAARRTIDMRRYWNRPIVRRAPLTVFLIGSCVFVALASNFGIQPTVAGRTQYGVVIRTLAFSDLDRFQQNGGVDGLSEIRRGQLWRLVTPIFLHYGLIHLGFNMFWLYYLGIQIEMRRGSWALAAMTLVMAVSSNLLQYFVGGGPNFLGISGVNYGLLGYIWMQKTFDPSSGFLVSDSTIVILLLFLVFGFVGAFEGVFGRVANWAHLGGLLAGMAIGYAPVLRQRR